MIAVAVAYPDLLMTDIAGFPKAMSINRLQCDREGETHQRNHPLVLARRLQSWKQMWLRRWIHL